MSTESPDPTRNGDWHISVGGETFRPSDETPTPDHNPVVLNVGLEIDHSGHGPDARAIDICWHDEIVIRLPDGAVIKIPILVCRKGHSGDIIRL